MFNVPCKFWLRVHYFFKERYYKNARNKLGGFNLIHMTLAFQNK